MALQDFPVWSFPPNWNGEVTETLSWVTDIMQSPTGSEQRRTMRLWPRRTFEFGVAVSGKDRTLLAGMLLNFSTDDWYLPIWHEPLVLERAISENDTNISLVGIGDTDIPISKLIFITNGDPNEFEILTVANQNNLGMNLVGKTDRDWPIGSVIYPVTWGSLTDSVSLKKVTSNLATGNVRFQESRPTTSRSHKPDQFLTTIYKGYPVLDIAPDEVNPLDQNYDLITSRLDNLTSIPMIRNDAKRAFAITKHNWVLKGRVEHGQFMNTLEALRGRAKPLWVPTFMDDLEIIASVTPGDSAIKVANSGYARAGNVIPDHEHIMIERLDGSRFFRKIVATNTQSNGTENMMLDQPIGSGFAKDQVLRISFMTLMRLNHDEVSIVHKTDTFGVSEIAMTLRSAPDTRIEIPL